MQVSVITASHHVIPQARIGPPGDDSDLSRMGLMSARLPDLNFGTVSVLLMLRQDAVMVVPFASS